VSTRTASAQLRFGPTAIRTRANAVTLARLLLSIPVLILIADGEASWTMFAVWLLLSCTDGLDGWLARRDGTTRSGAFLDPLADKFLVVGAFLALAVGGVFAWVAVVLVVLREAAVSAYRWLAARRGISVPARDLGKWKANAQFIAVAIVLFPPTEHSHGLHDAALWVAVAFSLVSALDLVIASRRAR
jgi:CDP-diacylglycerol---glycerol-3-phosphate 3-phosphatidyltransferase